MLSFVLFHFKMNLDEKFDLFIPVEREELNLIVSNLTEDIIKLCDLTEKINASIKQDTTACDTTDLSWLLKEKCKIIENVKHTLQESESYLPMTEGEMLVDIHNTLLKDNNEQIQTLNDFSAELDLLEENLTKMKESYNEVSKEITNLNKVNVPEMLDINLLQRNSAGELRNLRSHLHSSIETYFKSTSTKDLIEGLTIAYFQGGDNKYINVSNKYSIFDIQILQKAGLVVEDPYNKMRIKFDDFI